jgi:hypothetical protein
MAIAIKGSRGMEPALVTQDGQEVYVICVQVVITALVVLPALLVYTELVIRGSREMGLVPVPPAGLTPFAILVLPTFMVRVVLFALLA